MRATANLPWTVLVNRILYQKLMVRYGQSKWWLENDIYVSIQIMP